MLNSSSELKKLSEDSGSTSMNLSIRILTIIGKEIKIRDQI